MYIKARGFYDVIISLFRTSERFRCVHIYVCFSSLTSAEFYCYVTASVFDFDRSNGVRDVPLRPDRRRYAFACGLSTLSFVSPRGTRFQSRTVLRVLQKGQVDVHNKRSSAPHEYGRNPIETDFWYQDPFSYLNPPAARRRCPSATGRTRPQRERT